jgi:hypothetical protein
VGSEPAERSEPSRELLAIEVASIELAHTLRSAWGSDGRFSSIKMRGLQLRTLPAAEFSAALFP